MKSLHLGIITVFCFIVFFLSPSDSYASTCAVKETIYSAPQFFLLSDSVFAGTVTSITDYGNHQWQVHFDIEKIWKGVATRQTSTAMTGTLQACGYSIAVGEKYLIYTNGSPSFINPIDSKMYSDAQNEIALFDDPKFQSQEKVKEDLNKKLEVAQGRVGSVMMDKSSRIPISAVGVDQVNSTLDIVINDQKATLSLEQYRQSLQDILGDIPIKVEFGYATASAPILQSMNDQGQTTSYPITHGTNSSIVLKSPLQQFKSGIDPKDVACKKGLQLVIKTSDGSPACVKPDTAQTLVERGWAKQDSYYVDPHMSPKVSLYDYFYDGIDKDNTTVSINNRTYYQTTLDYTVDNLRKDTSTQFHGVTFDFPDGIVNTPGGSMTILDVTFSDGYEETYGKKIMNQDGSGSGSGIAIPSKFGPPAITSITVLSNHAMPQAGITIYHDKIKLLVSK